MQFNNMPETITPAKILLIIDGSLFIVERLIGMLKEVKTIEKIFTANDYNSALNVLHKERTDVVLLEIQLPVKDGIDLLKYINFHFPETKVIVLSNLAGDYYQKLCKAAGAFKFIDKSKDFDKIPELLLLMPD
jgi:DNA-binding NarL/FixJ family response regulator